MIISSADSLGLRPYPPALGILSSPSASSNLEWVVVEHTQVRNDDDDRLSIGRFAYARMNTLHICTFTPIYVLESIKL